METFAADEIEKRFDLLLDRVERGDEVVITRDGKAVARLVPAFNRELAQTAAASLLALRKKLRDRGVVVSADEICGMRDEGRR